jgi:hypothetical protein
MLNERRKQFFKSIWVDNTQVCFSINPYPEESGRGGLWFVTAMVIIEEERSALVAPVMVDAELSSARMFLAKECDKNLAAEFMKGVTKNLN